MTHLSLYVIACTLILTHTRTRARAHAHIHTYTHIHTHLTHTHLTHTHLTHTHLTHTSHTRRHVNVLVLFYSIYLPVNLHVFINYVRAFQKYLSNIKYLCNYRYDDNVTYLMQNYVWNTKNIDAV